jgi:phosphatidylglycerophosphate synthase
MFREAFILVDPVKSLPAVAGVPLLVRTVLVLQRAGVERCVVVGGLAPVDARIRCAVVSVPVLLPATDSEPRLVVGAGAVIDAALVRTLAARAGAGVSLEVASGEARVRVAPGQHVATNGTSPISPPAGVLCPVTAPRATIERALLRGLENPRDGYLDRLLHRRLSRPLTRLLLRTRLTPNAVTVIGVACGVVGGLLLGARSWSVVAAGLLCLVASGALDCSDGELARLRFVESSFGHWLDVAGDTLVHAAVLAGLAWRLIETGPAPSWPVLALLAVGVVAAFAVISWSDQTEERRRRVDAWENRVLDGVLSPLSTRDWYVCVVPFALAGRLDRLVLGAAVGAHVFWVTGLVLLLRVLRRTQAQGSAARVAQ